MNGIFYIVGFFAALTTIIMALVVLVIVLDSSFGKSNREGHSKYEAHTSSDQL